MGSLASRRARHLAETRNGPRALSAAFFVEPRAAATFVPLVAAKDVGAFEGMLFHVEKTMDYYVE